MKATFKIINGKVQKPQIRRANLEEARCQERLLDIYEKTEARFQRIAGTVDTLARLDGIHEEEPSRPGDAPKIGFFDRFRPAKRKAHREATEKWRNNVHQFEDYKTREASNRLNIDAAPDSGVVATRSNVGGLQGELKFDVGNFHSGTGQAGFVLPQGIEEATILTPEEEGVSFRKESELEKYSFSDQESTDVFIVDPSNQTLTVDFCDKPGQQVQLPDSPVPKSATYHIVEGRMQPPQPEAVASYLDLRKNEAAQEFFERNQGKLSVLSQELSKLRALDDQPEKDHAPAEPGLVISLENGEKAEAYLKYSPENASPQVDHQTHVPMDVEKLKIDYPTPEKPSHGSILGLQGTLNSIALKTADDGAQTYSLRRLEFADYREFGKKSLYGATGSYLGSSCQVQAGIEYKDERINISSDKSQISFEDEKVDGFRALYQETLAYYSRGHDREYFARQWKEAQDYSAPEKKKPEHSCAEAAVEEQPRRSLWQRFW